MTKYFKILFLNEKFYRILVYIYLLIFFVSPQIKFLNLKLNIFDTGLYTSNLFSIYHLNNLEGLISGHFQPLLYLISNLFFFTDKYVINILLLIQSFVLISPIFIGKKENKIKLLYLISFPVWYINFNGFHIDTLVIPLLYLCLTTEKIYKYFFLLIIISKKKNYIYNYLYISKFIYLYCLQIN